ncbi:hypothetical protein C8R44DRAFT_885302 [Mycena epipterygia]|nr:hypothetical protein C8R44DRAFT_885302 [Mycena epipterygia]
MNLITVLVVSFLAVVAVNVSIILASPPFTENAQSVVDTVAGAVAVDSRSARLGVLPRNCEAVATLSCTGGFDQEIVCTDNPFGCSATGEPPVTSDATCAAQCSDLDPLIDDMILEDPVMRPTFGEVIEVLIQRFDELCSGLGQWHLRNPGQKFYPYDKLGQRFRQVKRVLKRVPVLPPYTLRSPRAPLSDEMRVFFTQTS